MAKMAKKERVEILKQEFGLSIGDKVRFDMGYSKMYIGIVIDLVPNKMSPYDYFNYGDDNIPDSRLHPCIWTGSNSVAIYVENGKRKLRSYYNTPYIQKKID